MSKKPTSSAKDTVDSPSKFRNQLPITLEPSLTDIFSQGTKLLHAGQKKKKEESSSETFRIAVGGSMTTEFISRAIAVACAQENIFPIIDQTPYGAFRQEILDPNSGLYRFEPNIMVLLIGWRDCIVDLPLNTDAAEVQVAINRKVDEFDRLWHMLQERTGARVIQHLPSPPPYRLTGIGETYLAASPSQQLFAFNHELTARGRGRVLFLDLARLAQERGMQAMLEQRSWFAAKVPFEINFLPSYIPAFRAVLRNATARTKKALVLDLDNTLWGGVIGDDGVEGLKLGVGDPIGEAFSDFQAYVAQLASRGVILAVCSKNNPEVAATGFNHAASVLKREDFAAFECSWHDKAQGLRRIAATLNIGLDSLIFADDNPAECDLVRQELPEVTTIEMGSDPADFIRRIEEGYWFEFQNFTADDLIRSKAYQARALVAAEQAEAADMETYLDSLLMRGRIFAPAGNEIHRVAQLEQKTNQFNLLTRRYDEAAIREFLKRSDYIVWAASLTDKHGDHGLVLNLIGHIDGAALHIEEWLMSCRVFSRTFEQFVMREVISFAREINLSEIVGTYKPTPKNSIVADLYPRLGFEETGPSRWRRNVINSMDDLKTYVKN